MSDEIKIAYYGRQFGSTYRTATQIADMVRDMTTCRMIVVGMDYRDERDTLRTVAEAAKSFRNSPCSCEYEAVITGDASLCAACLLDKALTDWETLEPKE